MAQVPDESYRHDTQEQERGQIHGRPSWRRQRSAFYFAARYHLAMRRLLRPTLAGLCLLSLLACPEMTWLWWHSGRVFYDSCTLGFDRLTLYIRSDRTGLNLTADRGWPATHLIQVASYRTEMDVPEVGSDSLVASHINSATILGLDYFWGWYTAHDYQQTGQDGGSPTLTFHTVGIHCPHGLLTILAGLPPLLWLTLRARRTLALRRRRGNGFCAACGYDLRATPGRCPECGAIPSAQGTT
jgi:hypothetical protein